MSIVITSGSFPKALRPGLKKIFNIQEMQNMQYHKDIYVEVDSDKQYEERMGLVGLGVGVVKPEGMPVQFSDMSQGYVRRTTNVVIALGMNVTMEAIKDNLYPEILQKTRELSFSMNQAKQILGAGVFNSGYDTSVQYLDGQPLFSTAHVRKGGGTYSNRLAAGVDLSEESITTINAAVRRNRNERGLISPLVLSKLVVPPELAAQAERITRSDKQPATANNAVNQLKTRGLLPDGWVENPFLTDADAYFCTTNIPDGMGLIYQVRDGMVFDSDKDSDTFNNKFIAYERYKFDVIDVRSVYGSPGL